MSDREKIRNKLRENLEDNKQEIVLKGKLAKCMNELYNALRHLDSSIESCQDQELRHKLEKIRNVLGQDISLGYGFGETNPVTVVNKLEDIRRNHLDV